MEDRFGGVSRRGFIKGGVAAAALAGLAGCGKNNSGSATSGGSSSDAGASTGGVLKYYINDPVAIDPYNTQESEGTQVAKCLFDSLTKYNYDTKELEPAAAESWESNDDATQWTFHIRKDCKFHNGDTVKAEDFKRAFERICDPTMKTPSDVAYHLDPVKGAKEMQAGEADEISGVTCPDDYTLVFDLITPMSEWPLVCAHQALVPVPKAARDDPDSFLVAPIGNGPFQMDGTWVSGQYINVKKFDGYYGTPAKLDAVNFSIQKGPDTAFKEFQAGNIDFCSVPSGRLAEVEQQYGTSDDGYTVTPKKQVLTGAEAATYWLICEMGDENLGKKEVRQALSLAINRQNICDTLYEGSRKPATSCFPPLIDDSSDSTWEYCDYDPEKAKEILDSAGYTADSDGKRNLTVKLSYNSGGGHEDIMSIIQGDFEAIGVTVQQNSLEWAAYLTALDDGGFQLGRMGWIADYPNMDNFLYPNFYSTSSNNYGKYSNPEFDKLVEDARKITDEEERKSEYRKACKLLGEDMPVIPIMFYAHDHIGSERIQSLYYDPAGIAHLGEASVQA